MVLVELLFPKMCVGCGKWGAHICAECVNRVRPIGEPICSMCERGSMYGKTHPWCRRTYGVEGLVSAITYTGIGRKLVQRFKYKYVKDLTPVLVELIESFGEVGVLAGKQWFVVPVPLHPRRERWREFNQAEELGEGLARYSGWDVTHEVLVRTRYTTAQMKLSGKKRRKNLIGAFSPGVNRGAVKGKRVVLVDDVWTTGATIRECVKVLKRIGATEVWGLTLARAV